MAKYWTRSFNAPIFLRDGRKIKTLGDARSLVLSLVPRQQSQPSWQFAAELLLVAAGRDDANSTMDARAQLRRALIVEGLL
jgi:hypothetical protein